MIENLGEILVKQGREGRLPINVTERGLFVFESNIAHLTRIVKRHLTGEERYLSLGELERELVLGFGTPYYFDRGDRAPQIGYFIDSANASDFPENSLGRNVFNGRLISCMEYLHPKDKWFINNPKISLYPDRENIALFRTKHGEIYVQHHAFKRFMERIRLSKLARKRYPMLNSQQACLRELYSQLNDSSQMERKNAVLQIIKNEFKLAEYLVRDSWIYVIELDKGRKVLKTCYEKENVKKVGYRV